MFVIFIFIFLNRDFQNHDNIFSNGIYTLKLSNYFYILLFEINKGRKNAYCNMHFL